MDSEAGQGDGRRPGFLVHTLWAMRSYSRFGVIWGEGCAGLPGLFLQSPPTSPLIATPVCSFAAHCASSGTRIAAFGIVICHTESALATPLHWLNHSRVSCCHFNPHFLVHKGGSAAFIRCVCLLPRTTLAPVYDQIPIKGAFWEVSPEEGRSRGDNLRKCETMVSWRWEEGAI